MESDRRGSFIMMFCIIIRGFVECFNPYLKDVTIDLDKIVLVLRLFKIGKQTLSRLRGFFLFLLTHCFTKKIG